MQKKNNLNKQIYLCTIFRIFKYNLIIRYKLFNIIIIIILSKKNYYHYYYLIIAISNFLIENMVKYNNFYCF